MAIFPNVRSWCHSLCSKKTSQVLTLKNCIEPLSYPSTAYVVASGMALVSVRLFCKNLGNLQEFFLGKWFTAPPWQKIARTPMFSTEIWLQWSQILRSSGALGIVNLPVSIFKLWFPILNLEATRLCSGFRIWLMNSEWFVSFSPRYYGQPCLAPWWP